ncbi:Acyl-CoA thioesterase YbgC [invertebrate metagenome]|uniref:Acyl-CoA thioesterase YbgC n=1 Tax=invertebrate metagenome TaxID=1711999 RepID=A0A2H9TAT9_9ZZZZ
MSFSSFVLPVRIYYEDTDAGGVVYHANYLRFMERARTELLRSMGYGRQKMVTDRGLVLVASKVTLAYHRPAFLDDELQVLTELKSSGVVRMVFHQKILRDGICLCEGTVVLGCVDIQAMKPARMPAELMTICQRLKESTRE